ncbi:MAG: choline-sulfatase [Kiloniellales bacterium]
MSGKPNILFVMADQLAASFLPAYGHPLVKAPNIDRLAEAGTIFEQAYTASPLCAPARMTMMAGRLANRIGAYDNAADFPSDVPTFAHLLRRAGYRTALAGKMHFCGADQLHGFEERLTSDIYPADYGWTANWDNSEERPTWYHDMSSVAHAGPVVRSNQLDFDEEVGFAARRFIYDAARDGDERPFCLVVSFTHPHDPYAILPAYWNLYREDEIDLPATPTRDPVEQDPHSRRCLGVYQADIHPPSEMEIRRARRAYYGAISYVDDQLGELLAALKDCGLERDTAVVFTADHGDMLGERGLWYKMTFFDHSARVPLIVSFPGQIRPRREARCVSLLDLMPTLAGLTGADETRQIDWEIEARSLIPHLSGGTGHDEAIGEYMGEGAIAPMVMIRRGSTKFVHCPADPDQLYDLAEDPQERNNLAGMPEQATRLSAFRAEVARRWDLEQIHEQVLSSQRRRRAIYRAQSEGARRPWDFQPYRDASTTYMRNHRDLGDLERRSRIDAGEAGVGREEKEPVRQHG